MLNELLRTVLTIVVGAGLKLLLAAIGVEIDGELFNTLVAAITLYFLTLLGLETAARLAPKKFSVK